MAQRWLLLSAVMLLILACVSGGRAAWISSKAVVAQHLLEHSWESALVTGETSRPWPWADISTRAKLAVPELGVSHIVLDNSSGEAMAFGPGLVAGDPLHAANSTVALGGHRDTHLAFVEHLDESHTLLLENTRGMIQRYRLTGKRIVDTRRETIAISRQQAGLVLITCYPFNALQTGGPLRMVATAVLAEQLPG